MLHAVIFWLIIKRKGQICHVFCFRSTTSPGDSGVKADGLLRQQRQMLTHTLCQGQAGRGPQGQEAARGATRQAGAHGAGLDWVHKGSNGKIHILECECEVDARKEPPVPLEGEEGGDVHSSVAQLGDWPDTNAPGIKAELADSNQSRQAGCDPS